jgi:hypothetical protein
VTDAKKLPVRGDIIRWSGTRFEIRGVTADAVQMVYLDESRTERGGTPAYRAGDFGQLEHATFLAHFEMIQDGVGRALQLLRGLGLSERDLALVEAMITKARTGGVSEYEMAVESGEVKEEPKS